MNRRRFLASSAAILAAPSSTVFGQESPFHVKYFPLPAGVGVHDVAPARDGSVWFTGQQSGTLGRFVPDDGSTIQIGLGKGAAPHGVIIGPDGAPWVTEGGRNAIARVDPADHKVTLFRLPETAADANLNTAAFDRNKRLWFTGFAGIYGRLEPKSGEITVFKSPRGVGPYGMTATPKGDIWYASLGSNHIARIDIDSGKADIVEPPTPQQGARRVWSDARGRIWVSEWNSGQVSVHDPSDGSWKSWKLPGEHPRTYAVYVDEKQQVWLSDFGANAILHFDPDKQTFDALPSDKSDANVRQLNGRPGEVWGGESGNNRLVRIRWANCDPPTKRFCFL
jgi:virginiamycin B lyase